LLVLSPPAADGWRARGQDQHQPRAKPPPAAVKMMGDAGISADRIEVSMATSRVRTRANYASIAASVAAGPDPKIRIIICGTSSSRI